jgi:predicted Zn-dependent protease
LSSASRDELSHAGARPAADRLTQARRAIEAARFGEAEAALQALLDGDLEQAEELESRYMLAVARRYHEDYEGALEAVDELLRRRHDYARAWQEKGYSLLALNRPEDAALAFGRAVELNPGLLASWKTLFNLHTRAGREHQARFAGIQAEYLAALPKELRAVIDLTHEGRLHKAEALCRQFLRGNRQHVEGMRLLADIAVRLRIYDDAEFLLESSVEFEPGNVRARSDYLRILNRKGKFEEAYRQATILTESQPANPAFRVALANALTGIGRIEEGILGYQACLETGPNKPGIYVLLGHAQKAAGALDEAVAAYRKAYELEPAYGDAFWSLANTKTYRFTDDEIAHMKRYAEDVTVDRDGIGSTPNASRKPSLTRHAGSSWGGPSERATSEPQGSANPMCSKLELRRFHST